MTIVQTTVMAPYTCDTLIGQNLRDVIPPRQFREVEKAFYCCWSKGEVQPFQVVATGKLLLFCMVKHNDIIALHEATVTDILKKDETMRLLMLGAHNYRTLKTKRQSLLKKPFDKKAVTVQS